MLRILTDSAAGILPGEAELLGLSVVPLNVVFEDGTPLRDGIDLTCEQFYARLSAEHTPPKTSQPSVGAFLQAFLAARQAGEPVVAVLVSSALSGTLQAAQMAASLVEHPILLVDSQSVSLGQEILVRLALRLRDQGLTAEELARVLEQERSRVRLYTVLSSTRCLRKGGRMPKTAAALGATLGLKPLLAVQQGRLSFVGQARSLPGAYVALCKQMEAQGGPDGSLPYAVGYSDRAALAEPLARYLTRSLQLPPAHYSRIGPAVGSHLGPGTASIAYFTKE